MTKLDTLAAIFSLLILVAIVVACCSGCGGASEDCERVAGAIRARTEECASDWHLEARCDLADYYPDEKAVDACLDAVQAATCEELRSVVDGQCLKLFGRVGP